MELWGGKLGSGSRFQFFASLGARFLVLLEALDLISTVNLVAEADVFGVCPMHAA